MKECPRWRKLLYWCSLITWLVLLTLEILDVFPRSWIGIGALAAEILFLLCRSDAYDPLDHNRILKGALIVWAVILLIWGLIQPEVFAKESGEADTPTSEITAQQTEEMLLFATEDQAFDTVAVSLSLPRGWDLRQRSARKGADLRPLDLSGMDVTYPVYDLYDAEDRLVGALGCRYYEPYEQDADSVEVVYSLLRLGSVYRFDTVSRYDVVRTQDTGNTAVTLVVFQNGAEDEPRTNWGILSYDREKLCFLAMELDSSCVSEAEVYGIAQALCVAD